MYFNVHQILINLSLFFCFILLLDFSDSETKMEMIGAAQPTESNAARKLNSQVIDNDYQFC